MAAPRGAEEEEGGRGGGRGGGGRRPARPWPRPGQPVGRKAPDPRREHVGRRAGGGFVWLPHPAPQAPSSMRKV